MTRSIKRCFVRIMFVKGSTIRSKLEYVEGNHGKNARKTLEGLISGAGVSFPIMDMGWYPYEAYVDLLTGLVERHLGGDIRHLAMLGAKSADTALGTIYKPFVRESGFEEFALDLPRLHRVFYSEGDMNVDYDANARTCTITHDNSQNYADVDMQLAKGFYVRAAELHGLTDISCSITKNRKHVMISLSWL